MHLSQPALVLVLLYRRVRLGGIGERQVLVCCMQLS